MKKLFTITIQLIFCLVAFQIANAQTQISPKYSVDRGVTSLIAKGDTLIVAGTFSNVGIYTGGGALFKDTSDKPNTNFPKIVGNILCSTSDGNGGFYIYGNYRRESEAVNATSDRIEHVLSNFTFESGFTIPVNSLFRLATIVYDNGVLYIGGQNVNQIGGQTAGNLAALNVSTKLLLPWVPTVNAKVNGIFISQNRMFVTGDFTVIGGQNRNGLAAVEINTGIVKPWNPSLGSGFVDIKFYNSKIIVGGGFSDAVFNNHACALVDSVTGSSVQYIFNSSNLYWGAGLIKMALRGDTLYTYSGGTFDTRVTAINLASNNAVLWKKYFNMTAQATAMEIIDTSLYIVGSAFDNIYKTNLGNGNAADIERSIKGAVRLNLSTGNSINWSPNPVGLIYRDVWTMSAANKNIFIGGTFSHVNGFQRNGIAMLNTATDEVLPFNINLDYFSKDVNAIKLIDSTLYMAGDFANINGQAYLASVIGCNVNTGTLLPWHPVKLGSAWAIEANSKYVFLGGNLTEPSGGAGRTKLFAIDRQTGALSNWAPNPNNDVSASCLHISKNRLYVGGSFTNISGQNRNRIVSYDTTTLNLTTWQPLISGTVNAITSSDTSIWVAANSIGTGSTIAKLFAGINPQSGLITDRPITTLPVTGQANSLVTKGRYVIAGGNFKINSSPCNYITMYDILNKSIIPNSIFCQSFTTSGDIINAAAIAGNDLYIGGVITSVNAKINATNLERIKYPVGFFDALTDTTYSFYPREGGNGGDVTINFYGGLIQQGITVKLVAAGLPDITAIDSTTKLMGQNQVSAIFDLRGKQIGDYDVVVISSNGVQHKIVNGFKIVTFIKPEVWVQVLGPDIIRTGRTSPFVIEIGNKGNCNAVAVPLFLFISGNNEVKFIGKYTGIDTMAIDSVMYAPLDTLFGQPINAKGYWLLVPKIPAGGTAILQLQILSSGVNEDFTIEAIANPPLLHSPMDDAAEECLLGIEKIIIKDVLTTALEALAPIDEAVGCVTGASALLTDAINGIRDKIYKEPRPNVVINGYDYTTNIQGADLGASIATTAWNCAVTFVPALRPYKLLRAAFKALDHLGDALSGSSTGLSCGEAANLYRDSRNKKKSRTSGSYDPNDKFGNGAGSKHWILGKLPLEYGITFENLATATADAQVVKIIDTLDISNLDAATLQLKAYNFSGKYYNVGSGQNKRTDFIDLRPQRNLILKIDLNFNTANGILIAEFTSLDPSTLLLTQSQTLGFLPPNHTAPEGEGGIYFSINLKPNLANKTVINNKATIYFDNNQPITTPVWSNTIDNISPLSRVNNLPEAISDTSFNISWQGTDNESGIEKYDVFYSVNGGQYKPLFLKTNATSKIFTGKVDSTYSFYSIAMDTAGNIEQKNTFDTKTTIRSNEEIKIYPNPNNGSFIVHSKSGIKISELTLYDMQGRKVNIKYTGVDNTFQVSVNNLTPFGMYILKIQTEDKVIGKKILLRR